MFGGMACGRDFRMKLLRSVVYASVVSFSFSLPALSEGDPSPNILELVTPDRIAETAASSSIAALRTLMELEYEHLFTDIMRGTFSLSSLILRPQVSLDSANQCEVIA